MITVQEVNSLLAELEFQSPQWYRSHYGDSCRLCAESTVSRQLLLAMLEDLLRLMRTGGDFTTPLVLLAGTMLQIGYLIGRRRAEAEILEGWMRL